MVRLLPAPVGDLRLVLPAEPHSVATLRRTVGQWAARSGASEDEAHDLVFAVGEAVTNVVEHAYPSAGGLVEVEATIHDGLAEIVVRDSGQWRPPRTDEGGRGLLLMQELLEKVDVVSGPDGTEVRLSQRIGGAPALTTQAAISNVTLAPESPLPVAVHHQIDDIDVDNAQKLYQEIIDAMPRDAVGLVVDLSEVKHVGSAGIRMLYKLAGHLAQRRLECRVVVPDTSPVRRVLELSCFGDHLAMANTVDAAVSGIRCARSGFNVADLVSD
jgi:anti-anti-sigma factor